MSDDLRVVLDASLPALLAVVEESPLCKVMSRAKLAGISLENKLSSK